tara:strand:- start:12258 stop:12821 length:564 start_codon:yes stop_codon:yes gene_type:complete
MKTNQLAKFTEAESANLSLAIPDDMSFEEWNDLGQKLASAEKLLNWWIGDWWIAGNHRYGERAAIVAQGVLGKSLGTLKNLGSIARKFEKSRRRDLLSFSHHAKVASLPPDQADDFLDCAEKEKLSVRDLQAKVSSMRIETGQLVIDEDVAYQLLISITRNWNRAPVAVRQEFLDLALVSNLGVIDA